MLNELLGAIWRRSPKLVRRWGVRLVEPRFTVTTGAVLIDDQGRVLLLDHVFRPGSGWGIPGGFLEIAEQPQDAVRRELLEEVGLELESAGIAFVRALVRPRQIEIIFRCSPRGSVQHKNMEIKGFEWFPIDSLPPDLSQDQKRLILRALKEDDTAS
jgi:ADP-ribose pyrophosphatase YjhB (NUDIX family)